MVYQEYIWTVCRMYLYGCGQDSYYVYDHGISAQRFGGQNVWESRQHGAFAGTVWSAGSWGMCFVQFDSWNPGIQIFKHFPLIMLEETAKILYSIEWNI